MCHWREILIFERTPILLPNPTDEYVAWVQWVPDGFQWCDQFTRSLVRIVVVDLERRSIVSTRDLKSASLRFAARRDALYVANYTLGTA